MTPTNTAMTPEIKNIADNNGDKHTVVPTPHTHSQDDVDGLAAALAGKANAIPAGTPTGAIVIVSNSGEIGRSNKTLTDLLNAIAAKQDTLTFDSTPTANSTNPVTSGGVFSELAKKLSKVEVTDLDDLSEITDSGLYGLCLNTSGSHTTSFEYFLMMVERSLPLITYTLISSTGYKKRTYHVSNGWVGNDWSEYVYATTEFKPDGIESMSTGGSAKIYTYISDLTGDGRIGIELEDHLGNNVEIEITPENIANLVRALANPDSTPTANSDNLVTSGGVKAALNGKMDNKTIDQTPTDGNTTHLISSDAVYEALKDMAKWVTVKQVNLGIYGTDVYDQYGILVGNDHIEDFFVYRQIRLVPVDGDDTICEYGAVKEKGTGPYYIISNIDVRAIAGTHHTSNFNLQVLQ